MRVNIHLGGGHRGGPKRKEKRVPRNHHHHHYYNHRSSRGSGITLTSGKGKFFFGLLFAAIALLFGFIVYSNDNKTKGYIEISGYVIDYNDRWDSSSGQYLYSEIVEYTVDGKVYECVSSSSSNIPLPYGSKVKVYYNPINPSVAVVNQKSSNVIAYVICGVIGAAGILIMFSGVKSLITGSDE